MIDPKYLNFCSVVLTLIFCFCTFIYKVAISKQKKTFCVIEFARSDISKKFGKRPSPQCCVNLLYVGGYAWARLYSNGQHPTVFRFSLAYSKVAFHYIPSLKVNLIYAQYYTSRTMVPKIRVGTHQWIEGDVLMVGRGTTRQVYNSNLCHHHHHHHHQIGLPKGWSFTAIAGT